MCRGLPLARTLCIVRAAYAYSGAMRVPCMNVSRLLAATCCLVALAACDPPPDGEPEPTDEGDAAPAPPIDSGSGGTPQPTAPTDPATPPATGGAPAPPTGPGMDGTPEPPPSSEPGAPPGPGDVGSGGGPEGGGTAGPESLLVSIAPGDAPPGASSIEIELAAVATFRGTPAWRDADTPCDGGEADALAPVSALVEVPFGDGPRVTLAELEPPTDGAPRELWLVARTGTLRTADRTYPVHAALLCTLPDGLQYTLLRARPDGATQGTREIALGLGREQLTVEQVHCGTEPSAEECATTDDGQDADPGTRVRYRFAEELPAWSIE